MPMILNSSSVMRSNRKPCVVIEADCILGVTLSLSLPPIAGSFCYPGHERAACFHHFLGVGGIAHHALHEYLPVLFFELLGVCKRSDGLEKLFLGFGGNDLEDGGFLVYLGK